MPLSIQGGDSMSFEDLTGKRYGKLTVIERIYKTGNKRTFWRCKCDCGKETVVSASHLKDGHTKSCGCLHRELAKELHTEHGQSGTRLYNIYMLMKRRTGDERDKEYKDYGGRGIKICDEWENDFNAFYNWSINNGYSEDLTIDRINVNKNYSPDNCRWATRKEQANNRRTNRNISYNGETHNIRQWAEKLGINYNTLSSRINKYHWTIERAFNNAIL